jgi:hypothetical protein
MDAAVVAEVDHEGSVLYTLTSQQQTAGEMNEGLFWFVLIFVGIQLIELRLHCWIASCQFLD